MQPASSPASSTSNSMSHTTRPLLSPFQTDFSPPQDSPFQTNFQSPSATLNSQPQRSADSANTPSNQPHMHTSSIREPTTERSLPPFTPIVDPVFSWGEHEATQFIALLNTTYAEAIHWKINLFKIPYGAIGKSFVSELAWLFKAFAESSALESVALRAATIMPIMLLQKPAKKSKAKDHTKC